MKKILLSLFFSFCFGFFFNLNEITAQAYDPSVQASNINLSSKNTTSATVTWTRGNGNYCLVVVRKSTSSHSYPVDGLNTSYSASGTYGNGSSLGNSDNYVVYKGTGSSIFISGLVANTYYYVYVYEFNDNPATWPLSGYYYYYNTGVGSGNSMALNTLANSPTTLASVASSTPNYTSCSFLLNAGNGDGRLMQIRPSSGSQVYPSDGYTYSTSTTYGSGAALGGGYVVLNSNSTSFTVTNLQPATLYYAYVHEYENGSYPSTTFFTNSKNYYLGNSYGFYTLNYQPTISSSTSTSLTICQDASQQTISLYNITDGSALENQAMSLTATSANTTLIPNPTVSYTSPNTTGTVYFTPAPGQYGTTTITVTANDSWFSNYSNSITYTVTVNPKPLTIPSVSTTSPFCGGSGSLALNSSTSTYATSYNWSVPSTFTVTSGTGTANLAVNTPTVANNTTYTVTVNGVNSCGSGAVYSRTVQLDANPTPSNAGPDQPIICTSTAYLNANSVNSPNVGVWSWLSGAPQPSIGNANNASTSLTGLSSPNTYKYIWTITRTGSVCPAKKDTVTLSVNFANPTCQPAANFNYGPTSDVGATYVCVNSTVNFTDLSISSNSYEWDFNYLGGPPNVMSTAQNPSYTYTLTGTYTVYQRIFSNATGQFYNTTKTINVIDKPATPGLIFGTNSGICAGDPNNFVYSISSVPNATTYNWLVPSGSNIVANPSPTSIAVVYGAAAVAGPISVSAQNSCGTSTTSTLNIAVNPLPTLPVSISGNTTVCQGTTQTYTVNGVSNATSYGWTNLVGNYGVTGSTPSFSINANTNSGLIWVKGINSCGDGDSISLAVTVNPLPSAAGGISGQTNLPLCPVQTAATYSVNTINNATGYNWTINGGGVISSGSNTNSITVDFTGATSTTTLTINGTNACGNGQISSPIVVTMNPVATQDICVVSVDSASTHNEIYFQKGNITGIEKFKIYRKISATADTLVGEVLYTDPAYLLDTLSIDNPNASPLEYRMSAVDSCGNESAKSAYHMTMFMQINIGVGVMNLSWNDYQGQSPNLYRVLRDSTNTGNWEVLTSTLPPIGNNVYTDNAPPINTTDLVYRVETDWLLTCDPSRGAINTTRSNIKSAKVNGLVSLNNKDVKLYPNPASGFVKLDFPNGHRPLIEIYNAMGELMYSEKAISNSTTLSTENWARGIYFVSLSQGAEKLVKKLVID